MNNMSKRNSCIELLKVIGIVLIIVFHCYMTVTQTGNTFYPNLAESIDFATLPKGFTKLVLLVCGYFGSTGNLIFIICSSWFLVESDKTSLSKVIELLFTTFIISVLYLGVIHYLFPSVVIPNKYIHQAIFPVSYGHNWFVSAYILLYLIHGGLNLIIGNVNRPRHLLITSVMFFMYCMMSLYARYAFYYTTNLMQFITIYMTTSYMKKYMNRVKDAWRMIGFGILGFVYLAVTKHMGFPPSIQNEGMLFWAKNSNPFLILIVMGIVIWVSSRKKYSNTVIDYLSSLSLLVYLVHENRTFRDIVRPVMWGNISTALVVLPVVGRFLIYCLIIIAYGFGMSMVFNELFMPCIKKVCRYISEKLTTLWDSFCVRYLY